jgi:hypothetical protein
MSWREGPLRRPDGLPTIGSSRTLLRDLQINGGSLDAAARRIGFAVDKPLVKAFRLGDSEACCGWLIWRTYPIKNLGGSCMTADEVGSPRLILKLFMQS